MGSKKTKLCGKGKTSNEPKRKSQAMNHAGIKLVNRLIDFTGQKSTMYGSTFLLKKKKGKNNKIKMRF